MEAKEFIQYTRRIIRDKSSFSRTHGSHLKIIVRCVLDQ